jgi:hypothetical protein
LDITQLVPVFIISDNAYATDEDSIMQESDDNFGDFSDTVKYDIYAEDYSVVRWNVIPVLGQVVLNNQADFQAFHFFIEGESVTIDKNTRTITVGLPSGTDASALTAWFTLSKGATASVSGNAQNSGVSILNFWNTVTYSVTSEDGATTKEWTIQIVTLNTETNFIAYSIAGQKKSSSINNAANTITVYMPVGTDVTNLVGTFTLPAQATAKVNSVEQVSGVTANNFSSPVHYIVTAGDGTTEEWVVTISTANSITNPLAEISMIAYPNPNNGTFTLKLNSDTERKAYIKIISVDGKCVYSQHLNVNGETFENINFQADAGTYILMVIMDEIVSNQHIQIIH